MKFAHTVRVAALVMVLPTVAAAQQGVRPRPSGPGGEPGTRRAELEARLYDRFLDHAAEVLGLNSETRSRLGEVIKETATSRRELAREGIEVRRSLMEAVRDSTTSAATFQELLSRLDTLRAREFDIWRQERTRLESILTPRQQAGFLGLRARFNERLLEFRNRRRPRRR